ncbi:Maf family protein [Tsukamurella sp. 8F]|uniref:Maf family protein n=1 Tax=unclassified Tsukamurella TaxID=2633480 RepID=UPI0023B8F758|nr:MULTISPECIES: Maf family protein [unclassified Tsukamurella]MDF0529009.1 Maf family protein [Tsukamurella sp. 8J]MDF0587382.1 Maf family protein [Tsukamurella sp. 8F]
MTVGLVLASASPARLSVLRAAGVEPTVSVSQVDEDAVLAALGDVSHSDAVVALAEAKARDVAERLADDTVLGDAVVIGCDSMLSIGGELVGKPHTIDVARRRWHAMAGRSGDLLTGHSLLRVRAGTIVGEARGTGATALRFGAPSNAELEAYLQSGEPLKVAGAFTLDGLGGWFVDGIDGDPSSVIGISLPLVRRLLGELDLDVAALWA